MERGVATKLGFIVNTSLENYQLCRSGLKSALTNMMT